MKRPHVHIAQGHPGRWTAVLFKDRLPSPRGVETADAVLVESTSRHGSSLAACEAAARARAPGATVSVAP